MQLWTVDARMLDFERRVMLPPTTPLRQAQAGDYIKVGRRRERFWARVDRVSADDSIVATVDNELVLNRDLPLGVVIVVSREHVLEICSRSSEDEELVVDAIRAANRTGAEDAATHAILGWWETRKAEGTAYPPLPGTRLFVGAEEQPSSHRPAGEEAAESHVVCHVIHP